MPRDFKTILCPTDFSEESGLAIDYALRFAQVSDGTILLAHIIHMPTEQYRDPAGHVLGFDQIQSQARALLEEMRDKHLAGYAKHELLIDVGDPYVQLMNIARDRAVDLIVTATHGRTGIQHVVIGSVAEKITRHAPCPVFIVRRSVS